MVSRHLSRKVLRNTMLTDSAIEKVSRNKAKTQEQNLDRSTYRGSVKITIRTKLKSSTDSQVSRRCRDSLKTIFQEGKNTACNSTKDPINILSSQNHLSTTILSTMILKTHTHIRQVSPILYFKNRLKIGRAHV